MQAVEVFGPDNSTDILSYLLNVLNIQAKAVIILSPPPTRKQMYVTENDLDDSSIFSPDWNSEIYSSKGEKEFLKHYKKQSVMTNYILDFIDQLLLMKLMSNRKNAAFFWTYWYGLNEEKHYIFNGNRFKSSDEKVFFNNDSLPMGLYDDLISLTNWKERFDFRCEDLNNKPFPYFAAVDYMHPGPNWHYYLQERMFESIKEKDVNLGY